MGSTKLSSDMTQMQIKKKATDKNARRKDGNKTRTEEDKKET
jgi:hypothetical protein